MVTEHPEQPAQAGSEEGARKGFVCGKCSMYCSTAATFRIHIATHKKTPCPFCPQKFYNAASRNKHVSVKHSNRHDRKLNCRLAPDCKMMFNNMKELGIHSRQAHKTCTLLGVIIKIVLTVTERLMLWSNTAGLMERRHGMQPTAQRTRRILICVLCVRKRLTKCSVYCLTPRYARKISTSVTSVSGIFI